MRVVLHGDVSCAARALFAVRPAQRPDLCRRMIAQAEAADRYFQCNGRLHAAWGNGSLMAAARQFPLANEPTFDDTDYCACVELVLKCLREFHAAKARRQGTQRRR